MEEVLIRARFKVNSHRRHDPVTVRWTPEYLLGQLLVVLERVRGPLKVSVAQTAVALLESPQVLLSAAQEMGLEIPEGVFPDHILNSLEATMPRATPRYNVAVAVGVSRRIIEVSYGPRSRGLRLTTEGKRVATELGQLNPLLIFRASLAVEVARKYRGLFKVQGKAQFEV